MGFGKVDEVVPITCLLSNLWELLLRLLILACYASKRGLGECFHDRCEIVQLMVYLRWLLKHTSGWIGCGHLGIYQCCPFWFATQAQRDHKIIHAGKFCVQPQAIMGSGIVD